MGDNFFSKTVCDRCGGPLGIRTMSMYNTDIICQDCKAKERARSDYKAAVEAEHNAVASGDYNFAGIGFKEDTDNE